MRIDPFPCGEQAEIPGAVPECHRAQISPMKRAAEPTAEAKAPVQGATQPIERDPAVSVQWEQGHVMILRFTDRATGNLIQQIPSEEVVRVFRAIQQMLREELAATQIEADL